MDRYPSGVAKGECDQRRWVFLKVIAGEVENMRFKPSDLELSKGHRVALFLVNRDEYPHSIDIDELGVHVQVPPVSSKVAIVEPERAGQFHVYCSVAGHEIAGMVGTLTVR